MLICYQLAYKNKLKKHEFEFILELILNYLVLIQVDYFIQPLFFISEILHIVGILYLVFIIQHLIYLILFEMSSQILKQARIKTSTVKRLKKQYTSYQNQTKIIQIKIQELQCQAPSQDLEIQIKKQKQFLIESQSVLSNVKQKLIQSFEALAQFLSQKQGKPGFEQSEEKKQAEDVVLEVQTFLENITA